MANTELHRLASKSYIKIDNSAIETASSHIQLELGPND